MGTRAGAARLVGREDVLAALGEERDSSTIAGRTIIVSGEAGIGKTSLIRVFGEVSRRSGFAVVEGACVEIERRRPFGAFVDLLTSCVQSFGEAKIRDLIAEHALYLKPLLGETMGHMPTGSQTPEDQYRIHGSILALVDSLARSRPMVMTIEDLHWADDASLELFAYLARRIRHKRVLLIGTYRADEIDRRHPLRPTLSELANARVSHEMVLSRLGLPATLAILRATVDASPAPARLLHEIAEIIHRKCDGNPLFVEETSQLLAESGALTFDEDDWPAVRARIERTVPRSVSDVTVSRAARLSAGTQRFLEAAAVAGEVVDVALMKTVVGVAEAQMTDLLAEAVSAGLLTELGGVTRFRHSLTREAIRLSLLTSDRRALHRRIAQELERRAAGADEVAYHFDEAGMTEQAISYYEQAARQAATDTPAGAARALERAIELTAEGDPRRAHLYSRLSDSLQHDGRVGQAERAAVAAAEFSDRAGDVIQRTEALVTLARVYRDRGEWERNRAVLLDVLTTVEPLGPSAALASAYTELGICALPNDGAEALALTQRAINVAEAVGARRALTHALQMNGVALMTQGRSVEAVQVLERALALAREGVLPRIMRSVMSNLMNAHSDAGEAPEMERLRRDEVRAFDRLHGIRAVLVLEHEFEWLFTEGDWDALLNRSVEVDERARRLVAVVQHYVAVVSVAREGLATGRDRLWSTYHDLVAVGLPDRGALGVELALLFADEHKEAVRVAQDVAPAPLPDRWAHPDERGLAALVGSIAARISGDHAAAKALNDLALQPRPYLKKRLYQACVAFARAEVARGNGDLRGALAAYGEAAGQSRCRIDGASSWFESLARHFSAEVRLELGDEGAREAAQRDFDDGLRYWRDAKATFYLHLMKDRAHRMGLIFPADALPQKRRSVQPDPLTKRQREIAMLVANGSTNREIAERMTLSVRTAESHVEQIRTKLGFHTRAQIAAWVTERYGAARIN